MQNYIAGIKTYFKTIMDNNYSLVEKHMLNRDFTCKSETKKHLFCFPVDIKIVISRASFFPPFLFMFAVNFSFFQKKMPEISCFSILHTSFFPQIFSTAEISAICENFQLFFSLKKFLHQLFVPHIFFDVERKVQIYFNRFRKTLLQRGAVIFRDFSAV